LSRARAWAILRAVRFALPYALVGFGLLLAPPAARAEPPPVIVALVLDTSGSLLPTDVETASALASGILRALPLGSEACVFAFADESKLLLERTADAALLEQAISTLRPTGQRTALYDALFDASRHLQGTRAARRAIVLLTDGRDEGSALSVEDGLRLAQEAGIPVFGVGVGKVQEKVLRRVAKLTSGEYVPVGEATGQSLASRILATPVSPPPPPPPSVAPASSPSASTTAPTRPPAEASPRSRVLVPAVLFALAGLIVAGLLLGLRGRREKPGLVPLPPERPTGRPAAPAPRKGKPPSTEDDAPPETVFSRMELGVETVERTVFLREEASLEVTSGSARGRVFPLSSASATSLGRARANDVVIEDEAISGQHLRIRPEEGRFVLHDLGSTNGTKVNDRKVAKHTLQDGDLIRLGDTALRFRLTQAK